MTLKEDLEILMADIMKAGLRLSQDEPVSAALFIGACGARLRSIITDLEQDDEQEEKPEDKEIDNEQKESISDLIKGLRKIYG